MKNCFGHRRRHPAITLLKMTVWLALGAVVVGLVMLLWNWLMPALFTGARAIDYWQALGLIVLCRVLFGGGGGRWKGRRRWEGMSAEERDKLKQHFRGRHCGRPDEAHPAGDQAP